MLTDLLFKRFVDELKVISDDTPIKMKHKMFDDLVFSDKDPNGYSLYRYTPSRQIYWDRIMTDFIKLLSYVIVDVGRLNQKSLAVMMPGFALG